MPIQISYQPSAAAVGGAAYVGGLGDYQRWLNNYLWNQFQFGTNVNLQEQQMAQQRMLAMQQLAAQQQQQASQQAFQMQQMPMQAQLEAQRQYGSQILQSQLGDQASARDFNEAQQLQAQQAQQQSDLMQAREAAQSQGQMGAMQYRDQLQQGRQDMQSWQNPFATHLQNIQKAQQAGGYTMTDEQQQQADQLKNDIGAMQQDVASGRSSLGTVMPAFKQKIAQLNAIVPNQPPPQTIQDAVKQKVSWMDMQTGQQFDTGGPGRLPITQDPKSGELQVLRGYRPDTGIIGQDENGNAIYSAKFQNQIIRNQTDAAKGRANYVASRMKSLDGGMFPYGTDPSTGMAIPGAREQAMQQFGQEYDQMVPAAAQARAQNAQAMHPAEEQAQEQQQQAQQQPNPQAQAVMQVNPEAIRTPQEGAQLIEAIKAARIPFAQWPTNLKLAYKRALQMQQGA